MSVHASNELTESQVASAIDHALEQRHPTDTPEWWRSLGSRAPGVIEQKLASTSQVYQRLRLVQALGHFTDSAGLEGRLATLKNIATTTPDDVIRHAAIRSVGDASGGREVEWIAQFLQHSDGQTRKTSAAVLQTIGSPAALEKLSEYKKNTGEPMSAGHKHQPRTLTKSGSSVDQLSPDWDGQWKGFWIEPGRVTAGRLSIDAQSTPQSWSGRLVLGKKQSEVRLQTTRVQGSVASGQWMEQLRGAPNAASAPSAFEARVEMEGRHRVLRVRVPDRSGTLVLFR